jgi:hypothetical protein
MERLQLPSRSPASVLLPSRLGSPSGDGIGDLHHRREFGGYSCSLTAEVVCFVCTQGWQAAICWNRLTRLQVIGRIRFSNWFLQARRQAKPWRHRRCRPQLGSRRGASADVIAAIVASGAAGPEAFPEESPIILASDVVAFCRIQIARSIFARCP